jgi:hypothetical protein
MPSNLPRFRRAALACAAAAVLSAGTAHARSGDGAYGRLDGDLDLSFGVAGGAIVSPGRGVLAADARVRYFEAAGVVLQYEDTAPFGAAKAPGDYVRGGLVGVELRPLFPVRFLKARETGNAFGDLLLDSIGVEVGAWWSSIEGRSVGRPGLHLGLGVEVPLASQASGPWLRLGGALRWTAPRLEGEPAPGSQVVLLTLGLAWHQMVGAHVIDAGDRRPE